MENIEIKNIKLINLHASITEGKIAYDPKKVQAMLQVQYNFDDPAKKVISYRIVVGENQENSLYHLKCDYSFETNSDDFIEHDIVKEAMDILQSRIEEVLALITLEAGFSELDQS